MMENKLIICLLSKIFYKILKNAEKNVGRILYIEIQNVKQNVKHK